MLLLDGMDFSTIVSFVHDVPHKIKNQSSCRSIAYLSIVFFLGTNTRYNTYNSNVKDGFQNF